MPAIKLVVTKTDNKFCKTIPNGLKGLCANSKNFIIDAIINQDIQILAFEEPSETFDINNQETKLSFLKQLESTKYLCGKEFVKNINKAIENKVKFIKLSSKRYPDIVFASETKFKNILKSDLVLCIDCNMDIVQEKLEINAPNIVVLHHESFDINYQDTMNLSQESKKLLWSIKGFNPSIKFSKEIKNVINGEKLVIATRSSSKIEFPDPLKKEFNKNLNFFRLESACSNGFILEHFSYNNQFIDLIVYLNYNFGKIKNNTKFNIEAHTVDIRLKFYVNECMRTKDGILKKYLSIRMCKDIEDYEKRCIKEINSDCKKALENYVLKLPSIFQILMNSNILPHFYQNTDARDDFLKIRHILLKNYLYLMDQLIIKIKKSNPKESNTEELLLAYSQLRNDYKTFKNFCLKKKFVTKKEFSFGNSKLISALESFFDNSSINYQNYLDFFSFYDTLNISILKEYLTVYKVTADISNFHNYRSRVNKNIQIHNLNNCFEGDSKTLLILLNFLGEQVTQATVGATAGILVNFFTTSTQTLVMSKDLLQGYRLGKTSLDAILASDKFLNSFNFALNAEKGYKFLNLASYSSNLAGVGTTVASTSSNLAGLGTTVASTSSNLAGLGTTVASTSSNLAGVGTTVASTSSNLAGVGTTVAATGISTTIKSVLSIGGTVLLAAEVIKLGTNLIRIFGCSGYYDGEFVPELKLIRVDI